MKVEYLENCPVCKNKTFLNFLTCKDYTVSKQNFSIVECSNCRFKFTNPRPVEEEIGAFYKSDTYISHTNKNVGLISVIYKLVRKYTLQQKVKLINKYAKKGRLLDIGCGTGYFLKEAKNNKWGITGVEPDDNARKLAKQNTDAIINKDVFCCFDKSDSFDVITMWHVLEHVHKLDETLSKIEEIIDEKGVLFIAVPNNESYDAEYYKEQWAAYDLPRHLYHFSKDNIEKLLAQYHFRLADIVPMKFDSYYVSMLSEKYRAEELITKDSKIRAFINGLKSNKEAKNNYNYSSNIYVFKKIK